MEKISSSVSSVPGKPEERRSISLDDYRKKIRELAIAMRTEVGEYFKERERFFSSVKFDVSQEETSNKSEEDLFSALLEEIGVPPEEKKTGKEKNTANEQKGLLKKIKDKEKFKRYIEDFKKAFEIYGQISGDFYRETSKIPELYEDIEISVLTGIITGVYQGVIPLIELERTLTSLYNKNADLMDRLSDFPDDRGLIEIREKLERQKKAFLEVNNYFNSLNKAHLLRGLEEIEATSDCLIKANELISSREVEKNFITCIRCSGKNPPGLQICDFCKAVLPFSEVSVSSIEVSEAGQVADNDDDIQNEDVRYFKRLLERFLKGIIEKPALKEYMDKFSNKVVLSKKDFERSLKPFILKNPDVKELKYCHDIILSTFDEFLKALNRGKTFFENDNRELLTRCFSELAEADKNMREIKKEVKEYMEKYSASVQYKTSKLNADFVPDSD